MDNKLTLLKEAGKLAAYGFVVLALGRITIAQASVTTASFDAAFKK